MTRWVSIGHMGDSFAEESARLLNIWGIYRARKIQGQVSFALSYRANSSAPLLRVSKWIQQSSAHRAMDLRKFIGNNLTSKMEQYQLSSDHLAKLVRSMSEREGVKRFHKLREIVFYSSLEQLPRVIQDIIARQFFVWYPKGAFLYLTGSPEFHRALASLRVMGVGMDLADKNYSDLKNIGPIKFISKLQGDSIFNPSKHLSVPLALFLPKLYGFTAGRVVLSFVFVLDKPIDDVRNFYPRSGLEFFRSEASGLFKEDIPIDLETIIPSKIDRFTLVDRKFDAIAIQLFLKEYIAKLAGFSEFMLDPANFINSTSATWSGLDHYQSWLAVHRITDEIILLLTDDNTFLRKMALFRAMDQLASLGKNSQSDQAELFKSFLCLSQAGT